MNRVYNRWPKYKGAVETAAQAIAEARWKGSHTSTEQGWVYVKGGDHGIVIDPGSAAMIAVEALLAAGYEVKRPDQ